MNNRDFESNHYICYNCEEEFLLDELFYYSIEDSNTNKISCPCCDSHEIGPKEEEYNYGWY